MLMKKLFWKVLVRALVEILRELLRVLTSNPGGKNGRDK